MDYVPLDYKELVKKYLKTYQIVRDILEEICMINRELIRRREELLEISKKNKHYNRERLRYFDGWNYSGQYGDLKACPAQ